MTFFPAPSAPPGRRINIEYGCPIGYNVKSDLLGTDQKKEELCQIADNIISLGSLEGMAIQAVIDGLFINFVKGSVVIDADLGQGDTVSSEIDVLSAVYIKRNESYIASLNPKLAEDLKETPGKEEAEKIADIFFELFNKYEKELRYDPDCPSEPLFRSTVGSMIPGFKERRTLDRVETLGLSYLTGESGEKFKKFIQNLPTSLLSSKNAMPFLQEGLNLQPSKAEKILYLKQVLFLLTFQDIFKNTLGNMLTDLSISKDMQYTSSDWDYESEHTYQDKNRRIQETLRRLPIHDVLLLIPLACRASLSTLSESNEPNDPFRIKSFVKEERNRARTADVALKKVLEHSFGKNRESFSVPTEHLNEDNLLYIDQFLMGVSGLAISSGSSGRFPMYEHRTIYYNRSEVTVLKPASDNIVVEFLMTAAQSYPESDDTWIEERCLPYLKKMIGNVSIHDLDEIKGKLYRVRQAIDKAKVEIIIKEKPRNHYVLRDSAMKKLHSLFKEARREAGLEPSLGATSSRFKKLAM